MKSTITIKSSRVAGIWLCAAAQLFFMFGAALAEEKLADPNYRVATETPAAQPTATAAPVTTTAAGKAPFDLIRRGDEHGLAPVLRALKASQEEIDRNIHDYSCTLIKRERVDGELGDYQNIFLKVMHQPFSVYMSFLKPFAGREVVYVEGQNDGKLIALDTGFTRLLGKINLDPTGTRAMSGQKYPITNVGMRNLTSKLEKMWQAETQYKECEVTTNPDTKINGRSATMIQVVHPIPRKDFRFHIARLFFDNELRVPIHFDAFLWPEKEGEQPPLEESYTYSNLKINNGFTARDFDANNNPDIFKK